MQRYMVVEGVVGSLVSNPKSENANHKIGMRRKSAEECEGTSHPSEWWEPRKQLCEHSFEIASAVNKGDLIQHGDHVLANSYEEADAMVNKKPKAQPQTSTKEKGNK